MFSDPYLHHCDAGMGFFVTEQKEINSFIHLSCIVDLSQQYAIKFLSFCGYNLTIAEGGNVMEENEKWLLAVGQRITERRKKMGWTQEELADRGDLTPQFVSYAESGKRGMRPENLLKISSALGVSADYLLTGEMIDKDLLLLSDKLRKLSPTQLRIVENIVDECNALFGGGSVH